MATIRQDGNYSDFQVVGKNLIIKLTADGEKYLENLIVEGGGLDILSSEQSEKDFLSEDHLEGTDWCWVRPEEIGALTSAPIIGYDVGYSDNGDIEILDETKLFWFPRYESESFLETLYNRGSVTFTGVD